MVIETIAYCVGILFLAVSVFVLSREVVHLRREVSSLYVRLGMLYKSSDAFFASSSELGFKRHIALSDRLIELRSLLLRLESVVHH